LERRIGVGRARANRIARTEIIEAHQEASLTETELLESELGVTFNMEWLTTKDGRERDSHRARDGKIYTKEKCRSLMGEPNCRCAVFPSIKL
jgi:SPP1 gp7 family putative phage head morphogenesis protein